MSATETAVSKTDSHRTELNRPLDENYTLAIYSSQAWSRLLLLGKMLLELEDKSLRWEKANNHVYDNYLASNRGGGAVYPLRS
eukprot:3621040-Pleurochrysis_carterae.AAC.1